jgi:hypothetical protein
MTVEVRGSIIKCNGSGTTLIMWNEKSWDTKLSSAVIYIHTDIKLNWIAKIKDDVELIYL